MSGADMTLLAGLLVALFFFLWLDLHFFARGREPSFMEAVWWSVGWLVLSLTGSLAWTFAALALALVAYGVIVAGAVGAGVWYRAR